MEKVIYTVGERVDKLCTVCDEERGHVVVSVNKHGYISRVSCSKCATLSTFKRNTPPRTKRPSAQPAAPYDQTRIYRIGQSMTHEIYGIGEVMALIEPKKIDVLFDDRVRRLIHSRT